MNEQNNISPTPQQGNGVPATNQPVETSIPQAGAPVVTPVENPSITPSVSPMQPDTTGTNGEQVFSQANVAQPVQQPVTSQPVSQAEVPVTNPVPQQGEVPVEPVNVQPMQVPVNPAPQPEVVSQEVPVQEQPAVNTMQQPQAMQTPTTQDIVEQAPLNPIANNPTTPSNGVYGPSIPINGIQDATNVGFVAAAAPLPKKKNKSVILAIVLVVILALAALGYFVIYPYIVKNYLNDPKNVYDASIQAVFKGINNKAEQLVHQKAIYSFEASFDSNIESLKPYTGYSYGLNMGVDPTNKTIQTGIIIKNEESSTEHSYYRYLKDNKEYVKYSSYRGYIYLGEADLDATQEIFNSFNELFEDAEKMSAEDTQYLVTTIADLLVASIDENKLTKEDAVIKVNGEELKVTNNKYTVDYDVKCNTVTTIADGLKKDDKALEILSNLLDESKEEITEALDEAVEDTKETTEEEKKAVTYVHIYTYGLKNDIVGFEITTNQSDSRLYYYTKDDNFDAGFYVVSENEETGKEEENSLQCTGVKEGSNTKVTVQFNEDEIATLTIREWNESTIDFDYTITIDDIDANGTVTFVSDINDERAKNTFNASANMGDQYIKVSFKIDEDWTSEVANINTDSADILTDEQLAEKEKEFRDALMETPIGIFFSTVSNDYDSSIYDYYDNQENQNGTDYTDSVINPVPTT